MVKQSKYAFIIAGLSLVIAGCGEDSTGAAGGDDGGVSQEASTPTLDSGTADSGTPLADGGSPPDADAGQAPDADGQDSGIPITVTEPSACGTVATGRAWVVATDGDDSGDGTEASPLYTIQEAVAKAEPGDEILLRGGTYGAERAIPYTFGNCGEDVRYALIAIKDIDDYCTSEAHQYDVSDGVADAPIAVRSYPGEHAILDGEGISKTIVVGTAAHWLFEDLEIIHKPVDVSGGNKNGNPHDIAFCANTFHDMVVLGRSDTTPS